MQMLTHVVDSASYKPGWELSLRTMHSIPHLWVRAEVQDSNPPHGLVEIDHIIPVPSMFTGPHSLLLDDEEAMRKWVYRSVLSIERHEVGEWLRFGQDRPFLPAHGDEGDPYA